MTPHHTHTADQAESVAGHPTGDTDSENTLTPAKIQGWKLEAARVVWLIAAFINGIHFFAGLPRTFAIASTLSPATVERLAAMGLPATFPAWYLVVLDTVTFLVFLSVAIILFRRRAEERMALIASYMLVFTAMLYTAPGYEARSPILLIALGAAFAELTQLVFLFVFPTGHFSPRWTRRLLPPLVIWRLAIWYLVYIPWLYSTERTGDNYPFLKQNTWDLLAYFAIVIFGVALQIRRYRRESDGEERLQAKWLVWGTSVAVLTVGFYVLATNSMATIPPEAGSPVLLRLVGRTIRQAALCIVPITILYSVLRYRLWDIDFLINRTLVYVPLTSILAGIFAVAMTLTQRFFVATTGQKSDFAIVLTTLLLTTIIAPVRTEIQGIVDRRFKEAPDPFHELKRFDQQMELVANVIDHERLLKRLLKDTVRAFGATGGAVYLVDEAAETHLVQATEGWTGEAAVRLSLDCHNICTGWLLLGPRASSAPYLDEERIRLHQSLERVADVILLVHAVRGGTLPGIMAAEDGSFAFPDALTQPTSKPERTDTIKGLAVHTQAA